MEQNSAQDNLPSPYLRCPYCKKLSLTVKRKFAGTVEPSAEPASTLICSECMYILMTFRTGFTLVWQHPNFLA